MAYASSSRLSADLGRACVDKEGSDLHLVARDRSRFPAHKAVISCRSEVLATLIAAADATTPVGKDARVGRRGRRWRMMRGWLGSTDMGALDRALRIGYCGLGIGFGLSLREETVHASVDLANCETILVGWTVHPETPIPYSRDHFSLPIYYFSVVSGTVIQPHEQKIPLPRPPPPLPRPLPSSLLPSLSAQATCSSAGVARAIEPRGITSVCLPRAVAPEIVPVILAFLYTDKLEIDPKNSSDGKSAEAYADPGGGYAETWGSIMAGATVLGRVLEQERSLAKVVEGRGEDGGSRETEETSEVGLGRVYILLYFH